MKLLDKFQGLSLTLEKLRLSFWLVPSIFVCISLGLFFFSSFISQYGDSFIKDILGIEAYSAEGARLLLSTSAGALMTVLGVVFSITVVVLQQVSSQYSPRIISSFIKSRSSQSVLGAFLGTFVFSILLLSEIKEDGIDQTSIYVAMGMIFTCIALLVHYIHHISHAIESTTIIKDLRINSIQNLESFSAFLSSNQNEIHKPFEKINPIILESKSYGYIQGLSIGQLKKLELEASTHIRLLHPIGDLVKEGEKLWEITGSVRSQKLEEKLLSTITLGNSRNNSQDFRYGIRQLVDIALKALSPGVNDPSTAVEAIDSLSFVVEKYLKNPFKKIPLKINDNISLELDFESDDQILRLAYSEIIEASYNYARLLRRVKKHIKYLKSFSNDNQTNILNKYLDKIDEIYFKLDSHELDRLTNK